MVNNDWILRKYEYGDVGGWAGWYEDEAGDTRAFLGVDGSLLLWEDIQW